MVGWVLLGAVGAFLVLFLPFLLTDFAFGARRPRIEAIALVLNKLWAFLLAASLIALIFTSSRSHDAITFIPFMIWFLPAALLNIAALTRQRRNRDGASATAKKEEALP